MGLKKGPFIVADTVSVLDAYDVNAGAILLPSTIPPTPLVVATVDVCVKHPQNIQVSLDTMAQIAVTAAGGDVSATFEVTYEILRNGEVIATINDEMDYVPTSTTPPGRHTNFPNFPLVDNNPSAGINTYDLRCTRVTPDENIQLLFIASRSIKATVITL
ncbi:hypothetical protein [Chengkuizengella sediminis]|uniref:hypothetical protein n=1 Tax=Chengkuizengella sediminis TaxID=1885917 RepID=UPI001389CF67|nr:hypothetical protein [Chengkuizengella sediminis]NDI37183.1 hypothetical protein [Chengkuizengella sediminis]